jgi:hypothetical protein
LVGGRTVPRSVAAAITGALESTDRLLRGLDRHTGYWTVTLFVPPGCLNFALMDHLSGNPPCVRRNR